jgi:hypothetical protein
VRATGYPITWPTTCFIDGGCGKSVFAHTNGDGDFVLFDSLGWPWPVHDCYARQYEENDRIPGLAPTVYREYRNTQAIVPPRPSKDIVRMTPMVGGAIVDILGRVQDYVENAAAKRIAKTGALGQQQMIRKLGARNSQLTIVTDGLQSFTAFGDLRDIVLSRGMIVAGRLRAIDLLPGETAFVVEDLRVFRTPKTHR